MWGTCSRRDQMTVPFCSLKMPCCLRLVYPVVLPLVRKLEVQSVTPSYWRLGVAKSNRKCSALAIWEVNRKVRPLVNCRVCSLCLSMGRAVIACHVCCRAVGGKKWDSREVAWCAAKSCCNYGEVFPDSAQESSSSIACLTCKQGMMALYLHAEKHMQGLCYLPFSQPARCCLKLKFKLCFTQTSPEQLIVFW